MAMPESLVVPAYAGFVGEFEFEDAVYLRADQRRGGLFYAPAGTPATAPIPLVVFLHGTNDRGSMHVWFDDSPRDLRSFFDELAQAGKGSPCVVAAPSQTRDASKGSGLWPRFDLAAFVASVERAARGRFLVDRTRVVVVGHSGAGCNPDGGLRAAARSIAPPLALVAIDTCLDLGVAGALAGAPASTGVWIYWQIRTWPRPFDEFRAAIEGARAGACAPRHIEVIDVPGDDPHDDIVPEAMGRAFRAIFRPSDL